MDIDSVLRLVALLAGVALVSAVATDAVSTLVTTQRRSSRLWPTIYRWTWRAWRALGRRITPSGGGSGCWPDTARCHCWLLVVWVVLLVAGWAWSGGCWPAS